MAYLLKIMIFCSYLKLPEGNPQNNAKQWIGSKTRSSRSWHRSRQIVLNPPANHILHSSIQLDGNLNIRMAQHIHFHNPGPSPPKKKTDTPAPSAPLPTIPSRNIIGSRLGCVLPCSVIARDATLSSTVWPLCSRFFISGVKGTFLDQKYLGKRWLASALRHARRGDLEDVNGKKMLIAGE